MIVLRDIVDARMTFAERKKGCLRRGVNVQCQIVKPDGTTVEFEGLQTFSPEQIEWFKAGSALNIVRAKVAAEQAG